MNLPTLPSAAQDEAAIVACCLEWGEQCAPEAIERVPIDAITSDETRAVMLTIERLVTDGRTVNSVTVASEWSKLHAKPLPLDLLMQSAISPANLAVHIDNVVEAWRKRRIIEACHNVMTKASVRSSRADDLVLQLEKSVAEDDSRDYATLDGKDASDRMVNDLERRFNLQGKLSGVPTGFKALDHKTDGLQYGEQVVVGARPSMGKTAIGLSMFYHAAYNCQIPSLFISLEMSVEAVMRRLCASHTGITMTDLRRGSYTEEQFQHFTTFRGATRKAPLWITDAISGITITQLVALLRRRVRRDGIRLVVIDYLQKIKAAAREEKRTYEVGEVSSSLRAFAVASGVAMVTLAQLNRESEKDKKPRRPRLSDLGDSKQIEQDADTVLLIHRDRADTAGDTELILAKQRDGELGMIPLRFNGPLARFENPPHESAYEPSEPPETNQPYHD